MDTEEFRKYGHELIDWIAEYFNNIESYPVTPNCEPGEIFNKIPPNPPENPDSFEDIMKDFNEKIIPGMTHWQNPNFHAYFPANNSFPSILGEMLTSALGAQCMSWQTSPAATELEEVVMNWLRDMIGLPEYFTGVIQDTASTATLCAILSAREKHSSYEFNRLGPASGHRFKVYCSTEAHSSVEKDVKIAGLGKDNLRKIPVDDNFAMNPKALEMAISWDIQSGNEPLCVVATFGTTGSTAIDPIYEIGKICKKFNIWLHVDAAFAGTALVLPEMRELLKGIENIDSFVFNPHKWMFTNFDCSAYFVKDKKALIRTFEILPEYLKTEQDAKVNNYRDWGIQLGRRFRALKLWFVIRSFGVEGIREKIRHHLKLTNDLLEKIKMNPDFEILAPVHFNVICFRFKPQNCDNAKLLNDMNHKLLTELNITGKIYLTHTKLNNIFTLRFVIAQTNVEERHIEKAWKLILEISEKIKKNYI